MLLSTQIDIAIMRTSYFETGGKEQVKPGDTVPYKFVYYYTLSLKGTKVKYDKNVLDFSHMMQPSGQK